MKVVMKKVECDEAERLFAKWAVQMYRHQANAGDSCGDNSHRLTGEHNACGNNRVPQGNLRGRYPLGYMFRDSDRP